jgi:protein-S-isoprenylcysteine O-methyltransferase Ste14
MTGANAKGETAGVVMPPPLLYLSGLVLGGLLEWAAPLATYIPFAGPWRWAAGGLVGALGLLLLAAAFRVFRAASTPVPTWQPTSTLVTDGPYRVSRNPIYVALSLVYVGLALGLGVWWAFVVLPFVWLVLHFGIVRREEAYLERRFGEAYRAYRARTRRYL